MSTAQIKFKDSWLIENPMLYNVFGWELDLDSLRIQLDKPHREMLEALGYIEIQESLTLLEYVETFVYKEDHQHLQDRLMNAIDQSGNADYSDRFELRLKSADGVILSCLVNSWQLRPGLLRGQGQNISDLKESKARVAQTSASLKAVIENSTDYVFILNTDGTLLQYNRLFAEVMRDFHHVECKEGINLIEEISPGLAAVWVPLFERSKQGERIIEELDVQLNDLHRVEVAVNPVIMDGVIDSISFFIRNITSKWRISRIDELETRAFEQAFRQESVSDVFDELIVGMQALVPGMICYVTRRRDNDMILQWISHPAFPQSIVDCFPAIPVSETSGSCGLAAYTQQPVYTADIREHNCWDERRDIFIINGLKACYSFPLFDRDGILIGTMGACFTEVHELTAFEESTLIRILKTIQILLERDKVEQKSMLQSRQLEAISQSIPGVLYVMKVDASGRRQMEFLSDSASKYFNKLPELLTDYQVMREALEPEDFQQIDAHYLQSIHEHSILDMEFSIRKEWLPQPNRFHIQAYHDIRDEHTVVTYGYITDVTIRTRIDEEKRQKSRLLEMINDLSVQVMSDADPESGIIRMLGSIGEFLQTDRVYLFRNEPVTDDEVYTTQILEWVGPDISPQIQNEELKRFALKSNGFSRWVRMLRSGEPVKGHTDDFPDQEKDVLLSQGIQSILVVPVLIQSQWWGFLGIDACKGEREWVEYEISVMHTTANLIGAVLQQYDYRRSLMDSRALYRASVDAMAEGLMITDADGAILTCNQSGLRILGFNADQIIGASTHKIGWGTINEDGTPLLASDHAPMQALRTSKEVDDQVMGIPEADGSFRWLSVNARPIRYTGDSIPSASVATFSDITERINAERKMEQSKQEARRTLQSLFRNCTNSLKLASILLELEAMMHGGSGRRLKESSRRVSALYKIQESLFLETEVQNARLSQLLRDFCTDLICQNGRTSKEIQTGIRTRIKGFQSGSMLTVLLVVSELFANAVEHGLGTRLAGEVDVSLEEQGDYLMLEVRDNGIGLPPSFNVSKVNTLGLSVVKAILEGLEGTLAMHSDRGTQVLITIPLKNIAG